MARYDEPDRVDRLLEEYAARRINRRQFFQRSAVFGVSLTAAGALLAACGGSGDGGEATTAPADTGRGATPRPRRRPRRPANRSWAAAHRGLRPRLLQSGPGLHDLGRPGMGGDLRVPADPGRAGRLQPSLFESWEISDDLLTWTFKLRPDLKFHSGAPLDAAMMAENFNIFREPEKQEGGGRTRSSGRPSQTQGRRHDPTTVVVTMKSPFTAFPETLATENSMPVNLASAEELGVDRTTASPPVPTAPGRLPDLGYKPGTEVGREPWADYPGTDIPCVANKGAAYLDGIKWVPILEVGNRANEIESGGVNVVKNPAPQDMERLKANPDLVITEFPSLANYWIDLNNADNEARLRRPAGAPGACRPRSTARRLAESIYFGHAAATYGPIAPNYKWYEPGVEQFNQFDLDKAKSLLEEAGWTEGSGGIREKAGTEALLGAHQQRRSSRRRRRSTRRSVAMLKDVGVEMKLKSLDSAEYFGATAVNNLDNDPSTPRTASSGSGRRRSTC